ncbi:alpha/beta fold hydrolase [Phaeobacter sp. HF9A]|uniref:alpha/beta fold hydrolase n=1 Tax=Phaeobacter sp. HF9A TaxID=2721561 RepID=UPI001431E571|nr:alpha/beta hydrolase [Phaeobacter sp. HF9A]NIZ14375.1 alpha/beta hydrolase [Phaeobacter sp. HF9A]
MSLASVTPAQQVFHRSFGSGPRQLFAVHCSLGHSGAWRGLAGALGETQVTLTGFDLLSHGRSPDWDGQGNLQLRNTEAGLALLAAEVARNGAPVDVIGHSFGAIVALAMAQAEPAMIRSLTLIEPVLFAAAIGRNAADATGAAAIAEAQLRTEHGMVEQLYEAGELEQATRRFNRLWGAEHPKWPDLPESSRAAMMRAFSAVMACNAQLYEDVTGLLAPGALESLPMPVYLVMGEETQPIMRAVMAALSERIPAAKEAEVPGAGHMLPVTHPQVLAGLLETFWQEAAG